MSVLQASDLAVIEPQVSDFKRFAEGCEPTALTDIYENLPFSTSLTATFSSSRAKNIKQHF